MQVDEDWTLYTIPEAAALWCGIKQEELDDFINACDKRQWPVVRSKTLPEVQGKCSALCAAVQCGELVLFTIYGIEIEPEEWNVLSDGHIRKADLKDWILRHYPLDAIEPLFSAKEIEHRLRERERAVAELNAAMGMLEKTGKGRHGGKRTESRRRIIEEVCRNMITDERINPHNDDSWPRKIIYTECRERSPTLFVGDDDSRAFKTPYSSVKKMLINEARNKKKA